MSSAILKYPAFATCSMARYKDFHRLYFRATPPNHFLVFLTYVFPNIYYNLNNGNHQAKELEDKHYVYPLDFIV